MTKGLAPWISALVFGALHLLIVVGALVSTGGSGEGQAFTVVLYDFPLVLLLDHVPHGGYILYSSRTAYIWFFSVAGTLFHATLGFWFWVFLRAFWAGMHRLFGSDEHGTSKGAGALARQSAPGDAPASRERS